MNRKEFGSLGEDIAVQYLRAAGYKVVKRNFRCRMGEIDIIAMKRGEFYFVEVKTRNGRAFGDPFESVTLNKQRQIVKIAKVFISRHQKLRPCHFSVMGILFNDIGEPSVNFLADAFDVG